MGQPVICSCGQKNNLDSYAYGEPRLCVACGNALPHQPVAFSAYKKDGFVPEVTGLDEEAGSQGSVPLTGFESPSAEEPVPEPTPASRPWQGRIREMPPAVADEARCARCNRSFRGDWDRHPRAEGILCHLCATQADQTYKPPSPELRRELFRPDPPKKLPPVTAPNKLDSVKTKKELLLLTGVAISVLVLVNVFPVEQWAALLFTSDLSKAENLPAAWQWLARIAGFALGATANGITLFAALSWTQLLHPGGIKQNLGPLIYLGVVFAALNLAVLYATRYFGVFGPAAGILIGLALIISLMIKMLMIAGQFHIRMEGGVGFFLAWALASLLMKPCIFAMEMLVHGIIAAIAL